MHYRYYIPMYIVPHPNPNCVPTPICVRTVPTLQMCQNGSYTCKCVGTVPTLANVPEQFLHLQMGQNSSYTCKWARTVLTLANGPEQFLHLQMGQNSSYTSNAPTHLKCRNCSSTFAPSCIMYSIGLKMCFRL